MQRGRTQPDLLPPLELGEFRRKAGVSMDGIVEQTKISRRFLEAIESGSYQELPGGVFDVSYLRQYAQATGFSTEALLAHYRQAQGESSGAKQESQERGWLGLGRFFSHG
jgi:cytoskeletal protein RodZ